MVSEIFKSATLEPIIKVQDSLPIEGVSGIVYPPLSFREILELSHSNAFHTQCLSLKCDMSVGLEYEAPKQVEEFLESLTENQQESFLDILAMAAYDWECFGNGYLEIARSLKGQIGEIFHVHARTVYAVKDDRQLTGYVQETDRQVRFNKFGEETDGLNEIFQFKRYSPLSTYYGFPEWIAALEALRLDLEKKKFYSAFFRNFAVPSLAVVLEGAEFDKKTEEELKLAFQSMKGSDNSFKTLLLSIPFENAKMKFEKLAADFKDMPFDKLTQATREEILAAHGVPPRLVGIVTAGSLGGQSEAEGQLENFISAKIEPRARYLERRVKLLLRSAGLPEEFKLKGIRPPLPRKQNTPENTAAEIVKSLEVLEL